MCTRITLSLMSVYPRGEICLPSTRRWICLTRDACFSTRRWIYVQREMHFLYKEMSMFNVRCIFSTRRWIYVQREMHFLEQHISKCGCSVSNLLWPTYCIGAKTLLGTKTCFASPASHKCGSSSSSLSQLKEKVILFLFSWKWFYSNSHPYPLSVSVFVISQGKEKVIW